jgi:hypothetical protein
MKAIVLAILLCCAAPAYADSIFTVTGSTTITGNDVCGGPCIDTINFVFSVTYQKIQPHEYLAQLLPGWTLSSTGPLAPFNVLFSTSDNFFALFNASGNEIDLNGPNGDAELASIPFPKLVDAELYGCGNPFVATDPVCVTDFVPPGGTSFGHVLSASSLSYKVVDPPGGPKSVPEPSVMALLLAGFVAIGAKRHKIR